MPFYDYKCPKCGQVSEVEHGMNDSPEVYCTVCSDEDTKVIMKRLIGKPSVHFTDNFKFGRLKDNMEVAEAKEKLQQNPELDPYKKYRSDPDNDFKIR
jgi:putative FmdB family regulatory protein